jgi:hypothetical protein
VLPRQDGRELEAANLHLQRFDRRPDLRQEALLPLRPGQFVQAGLLLQGPLEALEEADLLVQLPELLQETLGSLGVLPEVGCLALLLDSAGPRLLPRQVKGSPADR